MVSESKKQTESLVKLVIEGILKKKGKRIVTLNLSEIENSICSYFVICHGDSTTQTSAIGESIAEVVLENSGEKPLHKEGFENANWILLDYGDVIIHVFLESYRDMYRLEELWADAKSELISEGE